MRTRAVIGAEANKDEPTLRTVVRGTGDLADAFLPPYGPLAQAIVGFVFDSAAQAGAEAPENV